MPPARLDRAAAKLWLQKWRWYHRPRRPWNRARLHLELARRQAFARGAMHGNPLQMLHEGRLEIGPQAYFEPGRVADLGQPGASRSAAAAC